ncbi:hypothetical protein EDF74_0023 [Stenotrophomonas rhizophila]|jgi:hypothetical protein|uniref:hypothetical protein n=1 Tax=Stenotrophomonas TaxID=40323 RepID=UPI000F4C230B|nr:MULTISPECIES: hypothetical protein [Stenotrophomonas]MCW6029105.1 hypothetical protein [Stenotrophomonas sp. SRS1]ROP78997.1 hypothetical protein EDF74_0023 [Stenotrophomonas rhizophila]
MSKLLQHADTESHDDDVAGLFNRLGGRDDTRAYQDFSHSRARASTPARPRDEAPPPLPAASLTPVVSAAPVSAAAIAPVQAASVETPAPATPARSTPLEQLFQRLAGARSATPEHSPLSRLRGA